MSNSTDSTATERLLTRVGVGDHDAFGLLLERHMPLLRRCVSRRLNPRICSRLDASDMVQETQKEALRRRDDFLTRRPMAFKLWLLRIAHQRLMNAERDHLAAAKRSAEREVPISDASSIHLAMALASRESSPSHRVMRDELVRQVRRSLARLSSTDREILYLRVFEGLSNSEAASLMEMKTETTKKRYARALLRLQALLAQDGVTEGEL